jgi:hypothetical protein
MRFWWSWRVLPPRPIANKFDDYRLRLLGNFLNQSIETVKKGPAKAH